MEPRIWLIAGPTASGKSALALRLARETGGEIVNADALQLYADLRALSARPTRQEESQAPHHLFGLRRWGGRLERRALAASGERTDRGDQQSTATGDSGLAGRDFTSRR